MIPSYILASALKSTTLKNRKASMFGDITGDVQKVRKPRKTRGKGKGIKKIEVR